MWCDFYLFGTCLFWSIFFLRYVQYSFRLNFFCLFGWVCYLHLDSICFFSNHLSEFYLNYYRIWFLFEFNSNFEKKRKNRRKSPALTCNRTWPLAQLSRWYNHSSCLLLEFCYFFLQRKNLFTCFTQFKTKKNCLIPHRWYNLRNTIELDTQKYVYF